MLFNSFNFFYFFITVFFLYYFVFPNKFRWFLLLLAGCYFYMVYIPKFILILFLLISIDFFLGLQIFKSSGNKRKFFLLISIFSNIGILILFKYFNFFNENISSLVSFLGWNYTPILLQMALPLGLSFHVFQSLSYVIEVYKGKQEPERNYFIYALYVMFFPQLVAGPIERPQHLLHQFHINHNFSPLLARRGLELMLFGFFKKLVIADWVAQLVDHVYNNPQGINGYTILIASLLFSYQIYCDFSGYSDIAVGSALVFGYDLTNNFNRPFSAKSIPDFWRRWHISLSNWLRDYLYYPIAFSGKRVTKLKLHLSTVVTFTLIGLWHGANWTYVVFGLFHGLMSSLYTFTDTLRSNIINKFNVFFKKIFSFYQIIMTFILVTISFIFFRSESVKQAFFVLNKIFSYLLDPEYLFYNFKNVLSFESIGFTLPRFISILIFIIILEVIQFFQSKNGSRFMFENKNKIIRWSYYYFILFLIMMFGYNGSESFIYFKF